MAEPPDATPEAGGTTTVDKPVEAGPIVGDTAFAGDLGLSKEPVSEELQRLAAESLGAAKPESYAELAHLDVKELRDAIAVLRAMYKLAARSAVPLLTDAHLEEMEAANQRFARAIRAGDIEAALEADDELHAVLIRVADNKALTETVKQYSPLVRRLTRVRFATIAGHRSVHRHADLINACRDADPEAAVDVSHRIFVSLEEHLRSPN